MALMHPPEFPAVDGDHRAERKMYDAVRDLLPAPWQAFHSIDWQERDPDEGGRVGEIDLVLCHPEQGIICLEVKGGGIECRHGAWHRRSPDGEWQATSASVHRFSLGPGVDPQLIIDRSDTSNLPAAVARILSFHRGARDKRDPLGETGVDALVALLAPSVKISVPLGEQLMNEEAALESLTQEQARLLLRMRRASRMVITGCAGSGKTMLAAGHAQRLARDGHRVLFVCFSTKLRDDLRARYGVEGLEIDNVHRLATRLAHQAGLDMPEKDGWDEVDPGFLPGKLVDAAADLGVHYDALMIDEAQDLDRQWLDALTCLLTEPESSPVWLFMDDSQNVFGSHLAVPAGYLPFELTVNCRNTQAIHREVVKKYSGAVVPDARGPEGRAPELVASGDQLRDVAEALERLCGVEEIPTQDVVVLSSHGATNSPIFNAGLPGRFKLTDKRPAPAGSVCFSSIRGFKGLEASVVILCELEGLDDETLDQQLYVGLSRAKTHCVIVAPG